jgi:predicted RNA-binding Zn-ribbon protein involved in translation (DUF1610 family)
MTQEKLEYDDNNNLSIVRSNLMNQHGYSPYCGASVNCSGPRTKFVFDANQFVCPKCGWTSNFPTSFVDRYKNKWRITS